jgi:hypothetical protein
MAAISTIALIGGLALSAAGTGIQFAASQEAASAQQKAVHAEQQAEEARKVQMNLEASRQKRQIIRQGLLARAQATATATNQGAQFGSALPGALGAITGQTGYNYQGVSAQQSVGNYLFAQNQDIFAARRQEAAAGELGAIGGGLSSLGGAFTKNLGPISRIGGNYGF